VRVAIPIKPYTRRVFLAKISAYRLFRVQADSGRVPSSGRKRNFLYFWITDREPERTEDVAEGSRRCIEEIKERWGFRQAIDRIKS